jgi:hypothetical protein
MLKSIKKLFCNLSLARKMRLNMVKYGIEFCRAQSLKEPMKSAYNRENLYYLHISY